MNPHQRGPFPNFLIIGAQKSATRWLRHNLGEHPDVFTVGGEVMFFNRFYERGPDWYRAAFYQHDDQPFVGEATPGYMVWHDQPGLMAARIDGMLPDVKLMAILRNPVDRAYSAYLHHLRAGRLPSDLSFLDAIGRSPGTDDPLSLIAGGWYGASLEPYVKRFGGRLLVLLHDNVRRDPAEVYRRALAHLGADDGFLPAELQRVRFSNVPDAVERKNAKATITMQEREAAFTHFADDIILLEQLTGVDLSFWQPGAATTWADSPRGANFASRPHAG